VNGQDPTSYDNNYSLFLAKCSDSKYSNYVWVFQPKPSPQKSMLRCDLWKTRWFYNKTCLEGKWDYNFMLIGYAYYPFVPQFCLAEYIERNLIASTLNATWLPLQFVIELLSTQLQFLHWQHMRGFQLWGETKLGKLPSLNLYTTLLTPTLSPHPHPSSYFYLYLCCSIWNNF